MLSPRSDGDADRAGSSGLLERTASEGRFDHRAGSRRPGPRPPRSRAPGPRPRALSSLPGAAGGPMCRPSRQLPADCPVQRHRPLPLGRGVQSPPGGDNAEIRRLWRKIPYSGKKSAQSNRIATQSGPGCDGGCSKYPHQYNDLLVKGRIEGERPEDGSPEKGNGFSYGGTPGGSVRERCAGLVSSSVGVIRGEPMTQAGAPFVLARPCPETSHRAPAHGIAFRPDPLTARRVRRFGGGHAAEGAPGLRRRRFSSISQPILRSTSTFTVRLGCPFSPRLPLSPVQLQPDA